jgi:hypothetical protein
MDIALTLSVFLLAGLVKGTVGLGLPLVSVALLTPLHGLTAAMALMLVPAILTNVWQAWHGPALRALGRRLWVMLAVLAVTAAATGWWLADTGDVGLEAGLGVALLIYVALALTRWHPRVQRRQQAHWGPVAGAATGLVVGATGVLSIPSVIYLRATGLQRDHLVQAMGLTFTVATLALSLGLGLADALPADGLARSAAGLPPALVGMVAGSALRRRIPARRFQRVLLAALAVIGVHLIVTGVPL